MAVKNNRSNNATVRVRELHKGSAPRVRPPKVSDSRKPPGSKPTQKTK